MNIFDISDKNNVINNNTGISIMSMKNKVCEGCEILGINDPVINMGSEINHMKKLDIIKQIQNFLHHFPMVKIFFLIKKARKRWAIALELF